MTKCILTQEVAIDSFMEWTDYYTKFGAQQEIDQLTRFRTGESPIVIAPYTFYNQLVATAPEISDKWKMCLVPGTEENGVINHAVYGTGTGSVIFKNSKKQQQAWEFIKWWTDADTQVQYNREVESLLGASARIATANIEALDRLPWDSEMLNSIKEQSQYAVGMPEAPGGYLTPAIWQWQRV